MSDNDNSTDDGAGPEEELSEEDLQALMAARLEELRLEHRRLDTEIDAARENGLVDMVALQRMKKVKLAMRDQIAWLENQLTPDIIA